MVNVRECNRHKTCSSKHVNSGMGKRQSKLAPRTLAELRDQTNFTVEEIQDWYKEFKSKWPKGVLTSEEFKKEYSTFFPLGDASEFAKHVFRVFDQNSDGKLDFREFVCGFSVVLRGRMEDKLKLSFQMYDINGNGFISREEMSEVLAVSTVAMFLFFPRFLWILSNSFPFPCPKRIAIKLRCTSIF